jgi:hypothetical protein
MIAMDERRTRPPPPASFAKGPQERECAGEAECREQDVAAEMLRVVEVVGGEGKKKGGKLSDLLGEERLAQPVDKVYGTGAQSDRKKAHAKVVLKPLHPDPQQQEVQGRLKISNDALEEQANRWLAC